MNKFGEKLYSFLIYFFLYAPILVLIVLSFNESKYRGSWEGFGFKWYLELLNDRRILKSFYYTVVIAVMATFFSTIIGTGAAIAISNLKGIKRKIVLNFNYIPVVSPDILIGISLMILFIFSEVKLGFLSILLSHITFCTPYVVLSVMPKLSQLNKSLYEAALDLGATPMQAIQKVIIPEILPGIFTGALLAFTLSLDDFVISFFNAGSGVTTLPITIYAMAKRGINPKINAISTIMFIVVLILLVIINNRTKKENKEEI